MLSSFTHTLSNTLSGRGSHASLGQSVTSIGSARRPVHVAVVGLSGADKGAQGVGKSCLCARFVRPNPDEYQSDHISVLSASDFAGRVVNNEHWLYWGHHSHPNDPYYECSSSTALPGISNEPDLCAIASGPEQTSSSTSNTGSLLFGATSSSTSSSGVFSDSASPSDLHFALAEHTEFVDDANFEPLHSGRFEPYLRRICQLKLHSPDKLMYVCKQQLGLEREFEQRELPGGRFQVDAFVCCFDVSTSPGRSAEVSAEATAQLLFALIRTGKPVMLATTKHDQASTEGVLAYKRLLQRRDLRQANVIAVETSAHLNVNIDQTFLIAASLCDRRLRVRPTLSFADALRLRQQRAELVTHAYTQLLTSRALSSAASDFQQQLQQQQKKVLHQPTTTATAVSSAATTDPTQPPSWTQVRGWLRHQPEYVQFVHLFGSAAARRTFDQQRASNADCTSAVRLQVHLRKLRALFDHLLGEQFERKLLSGQFSSDNITVSSSSTGGPCSESDGSNDDLTEEDDESDGSRKDVANRSPSRPPPSSSDLVKSNSVDRADLRRMTDEQLWHVVKMRFARHAQFDQHFVVSAGRSWFELPVDSGHDDTRVPFDVLDTPEAAQMFSDYRHSQRLAGKRRAMRARFRRLLQRTRAIQAGTSLNDARPLFVGRKCYERLSEQHVLEVWDRHQSRLRAAAMLQLRELLSERTATCARLLGSTASNTSTAALLPLLISHLCDDERYKVNLIILIKLN